MGDEISYYFSDDLTVGKVKKEIWRLNVLRHTVA